MVMVMTMKPLCCLYLTGCCDAVEESEVVSENDVKGREVEG
jgi:hypothetical protein